ncbi:HAD family hydrolase [Streptococcus gallolyticus]|uniref:HAD family hydrolase n=1 Tax=Streptococcus hepaticus TaxID=3349163 RepID=UPI001C970E28|nr:HAD family hydrolase [Streptococcus gallolyticus]MBY5041114.1 HAD family hydrolase [Streptococcus gallolyticus]
MYQTILFDLDGTLTDSSEGIVKSVLYALDKLGYPLPPRQTLLPFIGPPLLESFQKVCQITEKEAQLAIQYYREYFSKKGLFENQVYLGIEELLSQLQKNGKNLILVTSKPEIFAKEILKHFQLDHYFTLIAGASLDESRNKKGEVIRYALAQLDNFENSTTIMIGDRLHDIVGAKENRLNSMGVLYGFGSRDELETAGATYIADTTQQIISILSS